MASRFTLATEGQILTADYSTCVHSINQNNNCFFYLCVGESGGNEYVVSTYWRGLLWL